MTTIVKLAPDESVLFAVTGLADAEGEYGTQLKFLGRTPTEGDAAFHMTVASADRQLERNGLTRTTVIGKTVKFSAKKVGAKKFIDIDIDLANGSVDQGTLAAPKAAAATTQPTPPSNGNGEAEPSVKAQQFRRTLALYEACLDHVLKVTAPKLVAAEVGSDPQSVAAITATIFIRCTSRGLDA